jgi:hypothetical protein
MHEEYMEDELNKALMNCDLVESKNAIEFISHGATVRSLTEGMSCDDSLLLTYTIRLNHIQSIPSAHATRLAAATAEFVERLKLSGSEGGSWYIIEGDAEYQFDVFRQRSGEVIACLPVISKTVVSEERWKEIWGIE